MDVEDIDENAESHRLTAHHWGALDPYVTAARSRFINWPLTLDKEWGSWTIEEKMREFTIAQWNDTVRLLDGGAGYGLLSKLLAKARERLAANEERESELQATVLILQRMVGVLEAEAETRGGAATVDRSLVESGSSGGARWSWVGVERISPTHSGPQPEGILLRLEEPSVQEAIDEHPGLADLAVVKAAPSSTWDALLSRARIQLRRASETDHHIRLESEQAMLTGRVHVIENVLREFEVIGYVNWMDKTQRLVIELDDDQEEFVAAAIEAIAAIDDAETRRVMRVRKSFNAIAGLIGASDSLGWDKDTVETFVISRLNPVGEHLRLRDPLFEKWEGRGSGPGPRSAQDDRYEAFRAGVIAIATAAGMDTANVVGPIEGDKTQ